MRRTPFIHRIHRGLSSQETLIVIVVVVIVLALAVISALFLAGLMLPAIGQARESAFEGRSMAQMRTIEQGRRALLAETNETPDSSHAMLQALRDQNHITDETLISPAGPVTDGSNDYWINVNPADPQQSQQPDVHIAIYDRAMYEHGRRVALCFYNGTCDTLDRAAFHDLLNEPPNANTDFNLPQRN